MKDIAGAEGPPCEGLEGYNRSVTVPNCRVTTQLGTGLLPTWHSGVAVPRASDSAAQHRRAAQAAHQKLVGSRLPLPQLGLVQVTRSSSVF